MSPASRLLGLMVVVAFGIKALAAVISLPVLVVLVVLFLVSLAVGNLS